MDPLPSCPQTLRLLSEKAPESWQSTNPGEVARCNTFGFQFESWKILREEHSVVCRGNNRNGPFEGLEPADYELIRVEPNQLAITGSVASEGWTSKQAASETEDPRDGIGCERINAH